MKKPRHLTEWKKYRVLLMRIDTSKAPAIEWPTPAGRSGHVMSGAVLTSVAVTASM
ncbi:tail fiber assembly protein [Enterobacter roggenkampii]